MLSLYTSVLFAPKVELYHNIFTPFCFLVAGNRREEEQWEVGFPFQPWLLSCSSLVCPSLIGLKNEEEGCREQGQPSLPLVFHVPENTLFL